MGRVPFFFVLALGALSLGLAGTAAPAAAESPADAAEESVAARQLSDLFGREWEERLRENPLLATSVGRHEYDHVLPSMTAEDEARRAQQAKAALAELEAIDRSALEEGDRVSYDIFQRELTGRLEEHGFRQYESPLLVDDGFHMAFALLPDEMPLATLKDYQSYLARLRAFPEYVRQHIAVMEAGLARGFTLPRVVLEGYEGTISGHVVEAVEESVFYEPFRDFPSTVPEGERERLRTAGRSAIQEAVIPGYREFLDFMVKRYLPGARETLGAYDLPDGKAYYASRIRHFTTLDLSAEQIHRIGLEEVTRIRREMDEVLEELDFEGDFAAFLKFLRTDPRFYAKTPEELLKEASYIAKRMDAKLPSLFGNLPRKPYGIAPVPEHIAPKYTAGRYVGTSPGSTQPGWYWVNTYALETRPLYALPALTLHEAVPGHHLQTSLAQELGDLPEFRRFSYISAFGEGWGLYSEWLGIEAGIYTDPYSRFGRLTYEMWRACRLVVDTGLHAMGWSRQQAIDYMAANTALSLHEVTTETDRYIAWPAQALAYKLGELKIRELRHRAEQALGTDFDVRAFHDAMLRNGSVPLPVLDGVIDELIRSEKR